MKVKKKISLGKFIESIDWMMLEPTNHRPRLGLNEISVGFFDVKTEDDVTSATKIRIRLGQKILETLKWYPGDKIFIQNDPDDLFLFKAFKTNATGWTLQKETNSPNCRIHIKWPHKKIILHEKRNEVVKYYIYKDQLIFHATSDMEFVD